MQQTQPDTALYQDRLLMTSTRENYLKPSGAASLLSPPRVNTTYEKAQQDKKLQQEPDSTSLQHQPPRLGFWDSFMVRHAPVMVTNYEGKKADYAAKSFSSTKSRMEEALQAVKENKSKSMDYYKKQIVSVSNKTADFNKIYEAGVIDTQTGEYLYDKYGLRGEYEIALIDLDAAIREEQEAKLEYYKNLSREKKIKNSLQLIQSKTQSDTDVDKIFADLQKSLERFNITDVENMLQETSDKANDAVAMLQDSAAEEVAVEQPELSFEIRDMVLPSTVNVINKCKLKAKSTQKSRLIDSLEIPGKP